jgi:hypothetical protein
MEVEAEQEEAMPVEEDGETVTVMRRGKKGEITMKEFYCYCLMCCSTFADMQLHRYGRLFQQFVVDIFSKIEGARLNFVRMHQKNLRAEHYDKVVQAIQEGVTDTNTVRQHIVLPSSYHGSPRHMAA